MPANGLLSVRGDRYVAWNKIPPVDQVLDLHKIHLTEQFSVPVPQDEPVVWCCQGAVHPISQLPATRETLSGVAIKR